jgi:hypothetical protein
MGGEHTTEPSNVNWSSGSRDLLVRNAEMRVTVTGEEQPSGWVAITDGLVTALGDAYEEPEAIDTLGAAGGRRWSATVS